MSGGRVYVVEDEALIAMELEDHLRSLGYQVVGRATSGEAALNEIPRANPDLVLVDIWLAGALTGIDVAERLREPDHPGVVFLSAFADEELVERATALEPGAYLVKPFDPRELHAALQLAHSRKRVARERRRELLVTTRRLEWLKDASLSRFAGSVAHTLSDRLSASIGLLDLALQSLGADPGACAADLGVARAELVQAADLVRSLRRFAQDSSSSLSAVDLGALCRRTLDRLRVEGELSSPLRFEGPARGPWVRGDASELAQALVRLIDNSCEASAGEDVRVSLGTVCARELAGQRLWPLGWQPVDPSYAVLEVADRGSGIPEGKLESLFDPFFSTKGVGRGLGLALVLASARSGGGAVGVRCDAGGTVARVVLRLAKGATHDG